MQRRQQLGLLIVAIWVTLVVLLTFFTHRLGVLGLLGASFLLILPFRKR